MMQREFRNLLCKLRWVERSDLPSHLSDDAWRKFESNPADFFLRADDDVAAAIWRSIALQPQVTAP